MANAKKDMPKVWGFPKDTFLPTVHHLCPGCGEPIASRVVAEVLQEMGLKEQAILVIGIGCHTSVAGSLNIDHVGALHGRAPSVATGVKRCLPGNFVFTIQGDGDMVSEGIQEAIHCGARGEKITLIMLNNTVFGETGGHMTATTLLGQRTKDTMNGRDPDLHGKPIRMAELMGHLDGVVYSARGAVHTPGDIMKTRKLVKSAFEAQLQGKGLSFVEILTMCPTGWFMEPWEAPKYVEDNMVKFFTLGEFKVPEAAAAKA